MHILIITDIEGVSGVDDIAMIDESTDGYQTARNCLMDDVNAAVDGAFTGGADKVTVVDGHGSGCNFIEGKLDPRAEQMPAWDFSASSAAGLAIDAVFTIGCHAMAGTANAFLDHTQNSSRWFEYTVNGTPCGEIAEQAIWCGGADIPLVMMSGDKAACDEAKRFIPGIECAAVKTASERNKAVCLDRAEAIERIKAAAKAGAEKAGKIAPYKVRTPLTVTLTLYRNDYCDEIMKTSPALKREGRTLTKTVQTVQSYRELVDFYNCH